MLKTGCVFDRTEIGNFYSSIGKAIEFDNLTMFFALYQDESLVGVMKMYQDGDRCKIDKIDKASLVTDEMEEFLLKSGINYALTFNAKQLACDKCYSHYLIPMTFVEEGDVMVGDVDKIDFPSKCGCNHK